MQYLFIKNDFQGEFYSPRQKGVKGDGFQNMLAGNL
jgi:hypothetical protein